MSFSVHVCLSVSVCVNRKECVSHYSEHMYDSGTLSVCVCVCVCVCVFDHGYGGGSVDWRGVFMCSCVHVFVLLCMDMTSEHMNTPSLGPRRGCTLKHL